MWLLKNCKIIAGLGMKSWCQRGWWLRKSGQEVHRYQQLGESGQVKWVTRKWACWYFLKEVGNNWSSNEEQGEHQLPHVKSPKAQLEKGKAGIWIQEPEQPWQHYWSPYQLGKITSISLLPQDHLPLFLPDPGTFSYSSSPLFKEALVLSHPHQSGRLRFFY